MPQTGIRTDDRIDVANFEISNRLVTNVQFLEMIDSLESTTSIAMKFYDRKFWTRVRSQLEVIPDEPLKGLDWEEAYFFSFMLGGRLPTIAELQVDLLTSMPTDGDLRQQLVDYKQNRSLCEGNSDFVRALSNLQSYTLTPACEFQSGPCAELEYAVIWPCKCGLPYPFMIWEKEVFRARIRRDSSRAFSHGNAGFRIVKDRGRHGLRSRRLPDYLP